MQQVATLQTYFDACANAVTKGFEPYQKECELIYCVYFCINNHFFITYYIDENATDLDLEEPLDKNPSPSISNDDTIKNLSIKPSLYFFYSNDFLAMFVFFLLEIDRLALVDHAAMAVDFKGEGLLSFDDDYVFVLIHDLIYLALTFKATTYGVIQNVGLCIEMMQKREEVWKKKYEKVSMIIKEKKRI